MRPALILLVAACSNAADVQTDAELPPVDQMQIVDGPPTDMPPALRILVINEVAAGESPDWIEVVNATTSPIELSDFLYVDAKDDFVKAKAFPAMTLGPGGYYAQDIDDTISGFKLGSDEEVWVYRASDHALSDGVDWAEGASPAGMSYGRSPTVFGAFVTGAQSKGAANP
jgi:hypothetical protein